MKKGEWTFITNHGRLLAYLASHPIAPAQKIAFDTGLSIRAVCKIIIDLKEGGYVSWQKEGRLNRYIVNLDKPMRHPLDKEHLVSEALAPLGGNGHKEIDAEVISSRESK